MVSDSGQTVNCAWKYFTKINCCNLHTYTISCFTRHWTHHTLLHTCTVQHRNKILRQTASCSRKYHTKRKFHNLHNYTHTIHTSSYTYIKDGISAPVWVNSKIDTIKLDNIPVWPNNNWVNSNIKSKFLSSCKHWTCYIFTKGIYSISTLCLWYWRFYWIFSFTIKHYDNHPQPLHISSCNFAIWLLTISTFFVVINKLLKVREC